MCGPPPAGAVPAGVDLAKEAVITGSVSRAGAPVSGAYVRLLDQTGEFTAEVVTSETGHYRFFAAPGSWTVRVLAAAGRAESSVQARLGAVASADLELSG